MLSTIVRDLAGRFFISHSYKDKRVVSLLRSRLPKGAKPVVFSPIRVTPDGMVSADLIKRILGCSGLIYLRGGNSEKSFWVAFERDYALRAGLSVFAFDSESGEITADRSRPLKIQVFPLYAFNDQQTVFELLQFMERERFFADMFYDRANLDHQLYVHDVELKRITKLLDDGGYLLWFRSHSADASAHIQAVINLVSQDQSYSDRVLVVALNARALPVALPASEDSPFPETSTAQNNNWLWNTAVLPLYKSDKGFIRPPRRWARQDTPQRLPVDPDPVHHARMIQELRTSESNKPWGRWSLPEGIDQNRLDDLIVQLYWRIFKNTEFKKLD